MKVSGNELVQTGHRTRGKSQMKIERTRRNLAVSGEFRYHAQCIYEGPEKVDPAIPSYPSPVRVFIPIGTFPSFLLPLFQNESKCKTSNMKMNLICI